MPCLLPVGGAAYALFEGTARPIQSSSTRRGDTTPQLRQPDIARSAAGALNPQAAQPALVAAGAALTDGVNTAFFGLRERLAVQVNLLVHQGLRIGQQRLLLQHLGSR